MLQQVCQHHSRERRQYQQNGTTYPNVFRPENIKLTGRPITYYYRSPHPIRNAEDHYSCFSPIVFDVKDERVSLNTEHYKYNSLANSEWRDVI
jgi:hypothetical protein